MFVIVVEDFQIHKFTNYNSRRIFQNIYIQRPSPVYNPLTASAKLVKIVFNNVITPPSATFKTACTVKINKLKELTMGVVKTTNNPTPKTKMAAPRVAKISTMMRPRRAATAMAPTWRFSTAGTVSMERFSVLLASTWGRVLIWLLVEVMAAVILLIWSPMTGTAAVFSRREEDGERLARVASGGRLLIFCLQEGFRLR
jgi:hypothetical protein